MGRKNKQRESVQAATNRKPVSRNAVRDAINIAEAEFRWCFDVVTSFSKIRKDEDTGRSVLDFQLRLLDAIAGVEAVYHRIKQEEKNLISRKSALDPSWFARRMATLAHYGRIVKDGIAIGRAIGDGFAWHFYERDRQLIAEHLKHQHQPFLPPALGALGERLSLENMQGFGGQLLIYHGTTTFLRMGDMSYVDLKTMRVSCVVELKTQRVDDEHISVEVAMVAGDRSAFPKITARSRTGPPPPELPPSMRDRRDRQVEAMHAGFASAREAEARETLASKSDFHFDALAKVVARSHMRGFEFERSGDGLMFGALRLSRTKGLGTRMTSRGPKSINGLVADVPQRVHAIVGPELSGNAIIWDSLAGDCDDLRLKTGELPIMVWPIGADALRAILFGEVLVVTFYNPAHLWEMLRSKGFQVTLDDQGEFKKAVREHGDRHAVLENIDYFTRLVSRSFMSEASVVGMIENTLEHALERAEGKSIRVLMHPTISRSGWGDPRKRDSATEADPSGSTPLEGQA